MIAGFKGIGGLAEGFALILSGEFKAGAAKMKDSVVGYFDQVKGIAVKSGKEIGENYVDEFEAAAERRLKRVSINLDADITGVGAGKGKHNKGENPDGIQSEADKKKAEKEAAKAAKEELKRLHELEESKIGIMEEGHEKELANIRLKFKKKLDAIKGDGETENALRLQLAEECEKEVSRCELKYQRELAKINLANRLASVKEGSKEELTLRLAQLEASRDAELEAAKQTGADTNLINEKFNKERQKLEEEYAEKRADAIEKEYAKKADSANNAYMQAANALKTQYAAELAAAGGNAEAREEIERKFQRNMDALSEQYAQQTVQITIDMLKEILKAEGMSAEDREKYMRALADAEIRLEGEIAEASSASAKRRANDDDELTKKRIANAQNWLSVAQEALSNIGSLADALFDRQITKIEEQQEANAEAGDAEQERISELVEQNVLTEEEGEARKRAAEDRTAKKNEELEKKKQQLKYKQAVWDKANSVAQAGIATALAIMNALQMQPFPVGIAMAAIAGAMGAVQIATILATPIPKYAKGTKRHDGGPAIVGDGGVPEVVLFRGSAWLTPDTPTLVDIPEGASVIPNINQFDGNPAALTVLPANGPAAMPKAYNDAAIRQSIAEIAYLIRRQSKQQHADAMQRELNSYISSRI